MVDNPHEQMAERENFGACDEQQLCEECEHPVRLHSSKYGCECELGDKEITDARGFNYLVAAGPCGCMEWEVDDQDAEGNVDEPILIDLRSVIAEDLHLAYRRRAARLNYAMWIIGAFLLGSALSWLFCIWQGI